MVHAVDEHLAAHGLALLVGKHPARRLGMPHKAMANNGQAVIFAKLHRPVGIIPEVGVLLGMNALTLHAVLSHNGVEIVLHHFGPFRIASPHHISVHGGADKEVFANHFL